MKTTPFASGNEENRRFATASEIQNGFPCGPASQALFNGLWYRIESEIGHVIDYAGLIGTDTDLTQLRQAIQQLILSGLAGLEDTAGTIDTSQFLLIGQARARLPIFPEILTVGGTMGVTTTGAGNVRVPAGVSFQHRGIFPLNTVLTDFATSANKTYHLRWNPTDGFVLKDLADVAYNAGVLPESDVSFDSSFDDMLVARVVTNGSNLPTITDLINKDRLGIAQNIIGANMRSGSGYGRAFDFVHTYNWSRRPKSFSLTLSNRIASAADQERHLFNIRPVGDSDANLVSQSAQYDVTRYRVSQVVAMERCTSAQMHFAGNA